jgi:hypothetical protein
MRQKNILLLAVPVFCCCMMRPIGGKANVLAPAQITDTVISPQDLKSFEGYYKMGDAYTGLDSNSRIKEVQLKASDLKALEGKYEMQNDRGEELFIQIRATDKALILKQGWDSQEMPFVATSDVDFYCK